MYIQCPDDISKIYEPIYHRNSIFLAGGIAGCDDWQSYVASKIQGKEVAVVNPRRVVFDNSITTEEHITPSRCVDILCSGLLHQH